MKKDGRNTASTLSMASKRGIATSRLAARTACAFFSPCARCTWMFSISTVPSSTSTPTASARPPRVMILIVWPVSRSSTTAVSNANGMVMTTIRELRQSPRKSKIIRPVSPAPIRPSRNTERRAARTYCDWSNS